MNKHIIKYNTKCDNWQNVEGFNDAKCICPRCRMNRALKPKEKLTGSERMETARLKFIGSKGGFETREQFNERKNQGVV